MWLEISPGTEACATQLDENQPFPPNSRVLHASWGNGQMLRYEGDTMVVLFDEVGYKTLAIAIVESEGLLAAA